MSFRRLILASAIILVTLSCSRDAFTVPVRNRIALRLASSPDTRAGAVCAASLEGCTISLAATAGEGNAERVFAGMNGETIVADSEGVATSVRFWPSAEQVPNLNFYVLGCIHTIGMSGSDVYLELTRSEVEEGMTDYIYGYLPAAVNDGFPKRIVCRHLMAWLYDIQFKTASPGVTATINSLSVSTPATLSLDLRTGRPRTFSGESSLPAIEPSAMLVDYGGYSSIGQSAVSSFRVPALSGDGEAFSTFGCIALEVNYTVMRGTYSETLSKRATVNLKQGCRNVIRAVLPDNAAEMEAGVSVSDWNEKYMDLGVL